MVVSEENLCWMVVKFEYDRGFVVDKNENDMILHMNDHTDAWCELNSMYWTEKKPRNNCDYCSKIDWDDIGMFKKDDETWMKTYELWCSKFAIDSGALVLK